MDVSPGFQPQRSPRAKFVGLGYFSVFVVALAFFALGSVALKAMGADVESAKRAVAEAARPADIKIITLVAANCDRCYDVRSFANSLTQNKKVRLTEQKTMDYVSADGAALVKQYNLERIPAFIVQGEVGKMLTALPQFKTYGAQQGADFVSTSLPAPYVQAADGKIRGDFDAVYVSEKQCKECYDPTDNRQALAQLGMVPRNEKTVDRADPEGQKLVKQYALTTTPTVILTGDLAAYDRFPGIWKNVGTVEPDGAYVFRQGQDVMGTYYDLVAKKAITPKQTTNTNTKTSQ